MTEWWMGAFVVLFAGMAGYYLRFIFGRYAIKSLEHEAKRMLEDAKRSADSIRQQADLQAKAAMIKVRDEFELEVKTRRQELATLEERVTQRELNLDRKVIMIDKKYQTIEQKLLENEKKEAEINRQKEEYANLVKNEREKLQRIAGMTQDEAKRAIMTRTEEEIRGETGMLIRRLQEEAKETAEREAKKIVAQAVQRYAAGHVSELMTSTVTLPSEELKGRIIGREGRNIRALESTTGVDLLVDDTPEAVVISAFDPMRREIAKQSLEKLIADGRIHPARIEEVVSKVKEEMDEIIRTAGEEAVYAVGLQGLDPDLVRTLGRLKFRSSYAQNVLMHSIEVAHLMGIMAGELGLDIILAKKIGLLHDIGKALDSETEGSHATIGVDFLRRRNEQPIVLNAVAAHHGDAEAESIYAILCSAADAISAARPGARSEVTEMYIKRLEQLEAIAAGFEGVEKSYAIQAGREVRILVFPDKIDDAAAMHLARDISKKIEQDLQYPGQIKVTVIRENRFVEYAK
jgi:ribonuclease Y